MRLLRPRPPQRRGKLSSDKSVAGFNFSIGRKLETPARNKRRARAQARKVESRHAKMQELIRQAESQLVRRRFASSTELIAAVYSSLVQYLEDRELIRTVPFDAAACKDATLADLDEARLAGFVRQARNARGFPLAAEVEPTELLTHLNLLHKGLPTNAAVLLFGRQPQRFLITSEVKCAHFHGVEVAKPIPSYQVYKGTVFDLVDQAVDFVLSKINLWVGTREAGSQVPVEYEIPREVVTEAIVNAVAHRDYTSNGSVQVMLFADRLEIWNPGALPPSLTLETLRQPHGSMPANPLLAEPMYLTRYIERMGTGIRDMIQKCREAGLPEPEFTVSDGFTVRIMRKAGQVTGQVDPWIIRVLSACQSQPLKSGEIQAISGIRHRETFQRNYLDHLLAEALLERTIPDKPNSPQQKYRITPKGRQVLAQSKG